MRYEEIILRRIHCEKAPQVVTAWLVLDVSSVYIFKYSNFACLQQI